MTETARPAPRFGEENAGYGSDVGRIRIGISGWSYDEWRGDFYPEGLARSRQLAHAASVFDTIEVNGTFYSLTSPGTVRSWYEAAPAVFTYALKGSRYITHTKRLKDPAPALANFFASGVLELDDKLGPFLWQLPPTLRYERDRVERFLGLLPRHTDDARRLAAHHDERVEDPSYGPDTAHRIRHVLEIRHDSFLSDEAIGLAADAGVALAFSHAADWPYLEDVTAGFVYLRLHGPGEPYASPYGAALDSWADRIVRWQGGSEPADAVRYGQRTPPSRKERDVYVYFDNDVGGHAPRDAQRLGSIVEARS